MATGIWLLLAGPSSRGTVLPLHKVSFIVWGVFFAIHLLGHLPGMARALHIDVAGIRPAPTVRGGGMGRSLSLLGVLVLGVILAVIAIPDFAPWIHAQGFDH